MGLKKDDMILEKIALLHDNGIDMHTQIVLCPGINDGAILEKTVGDLYRYHERIVSLAIVPVGLTDHRFGLHELRKVDSAYANQLLSVTKEWQARFLRETGRRFIYPSDEFYIVAGLPIPQEDDYDGFPQIENGVGMVRLFLREFARQSTRLPRSLKTPRRLTMVTAELPAAIICDDILPRLKKIKGLDVSVEVVPNQLYGRSVTVAGLLSGKCIYSALQGRDCGDLLLLPPEILNADGYLLDDTTVDQLEEQLNVPVFVFDGKWSQVFDRLIHQKEKPHPGIATV
jgi:putative radical SAM enzyme (TIGR03279 family)